MSIIDFTSILIFILIAVLNLACLLSPINPETEKGDE